MGGINIGRVIIGGLLAGLVLNVGEYLLNEVLLAAQWADFMAEAGLTAFSTGQAAIFIVTTVAVGIVLVWIYAAIRPRFGPGPKTAVIAGLTLWSIGWLLYGISFAASGLFPLGLSLAPIPWGLVEVPLAALAGAWLYREG